MISKKIIAMATLLASCAHFSETKPPHREIAQEETCKDIIQKVYHRDIDDSELNEALLTRKLISLQDRVYTINQPQIDWYNDAKKRLLTLIKSWNNNRYPLFYLDNSDEIVPIAKSYASILNEELAGPISAESKTKLDLINSWIDSYKYFEIEMNQLLDEKISYQYNIEVLKQLNLKDKNPVDVKLNLKIAGKNVTEIVTIRNEDRNRAFIISELEKKIKEFDGSAISFGKIQERVIKQAIANDILTILHRELEFSLKNSSSLPEEIAKKFTEIDLLLKDRNLQSSSYGTHKVVNHIFRKEVVELLKLDAPFKKIKNMNQFNIREQIEKVFNKKTNSNANLIQDKQVVEKNTEKIVSTAELNKDSPIKKLYAKIATFTPYQKFMVSTKLSVIGYGAYRYFVVKPTPTAVEVTDRNGAIDVSEHESAIKNTDKIENEKSQEESSLIEKLLDHLFKKSKF